MGLAILLLAGAVLGWAGAIVLQREQRLCVMICICTGAVGALVSVYFRDPDHNLVEVSNYEVSDDTG